MISLDSLPNISDKMDVGYTVQNFLWKILRACKFWIAVKAFLSSC